MYDEVLTVTAMADYNGTGRYVGGITPQCGLSDPDDTFSAYSNYAFSPADQNHTAAAPGNCILTTTPDGGYLPFSGTSAAAPLATGVVALCLQAAPPSGCKGLSVPQIISAVRSQAFDYGTSHPNHRFVGDGFSTRSGHYFGYLVEADTH